MDYNEYMSKAEAMVAKMSEAEKEKCLLNIIRTTAAGEREKTLDMLSDKAEGINGLLQKEMLKIQEWLEKIENEELYFTATGYEDYSSGYWNSDWIYEYSDPMEIIPMIRQAINCAESLIYHKCYQEALSLLDWLCKVTFLIVDEDAGEGFNYDLEQLDSEIFKVGLNYVASMLLYAQYQVTVGLERVKKMYTCYSWKICQQVSLGNLFSFGPEPLSDKEAFLKDWIKFLKNISSPIAQKLMTDAVKNSPQYKNNESLHRLAAETADNHPANYLLCIQRMRADDEMQEAVQIGLEAMNKVSRKNLIRSEIALLTVELAEQIGDVDALKICQQEAFYSDSKLANLFPVLALPLTEKEKLKLKTFIKNTGTVTDKTILLFFLGDFETVYQEEFKNKKPLGWRSCSKGAVIPLFLLLMDDEIDSPAAEVMLKEAANQVYGGNYSEFKEEFIHWKSQTALPEEDAQRYFKWCKREVEKRAAAMLVNKYRDHYLRIAALLIVMGEADEALGMVDGKNKVVQKYAEMHSRRRNFRADLRDLGGEF